MIKTVTVRGKEIGAGVPGIIVPIVEVTEAKILEKAAAIRNLAIDMVEWRVDFFEHALEPEQVLNTLQRLREALPSLPLLFTFRTAEEGGEKEISLSEYTALNRLAAESGSADLIDVQIFMDDETARENIAAIHAAGALVIGSNHDFHKTPPREEILYRLRKMQDMNADIPKIAVMPQNKKDVLTLLAATEEMTTNYADRPIITMSMAGTGVISRLCGEVFGSALTFGAAKKASAPGQAAVNDLNNTLQFLHENQGL